MSANVGGRAVGGLTREPRLGSGLPDVARGEAGPPNPALCPPPAAGAGSSHPHLDTYPHAPPTSLFPTTFRLAQRFTTPALPNT